MGDCRQYLQPSYNERHKEMAMRKRSALARNRLGLGLALLTLVAATAVPLTALGADRMVLGEEFTNGG